MPAGALVAARQALGQYLVYGKPWQRRLIVAGVVAAGPGLLVAGIVTGHFAMAGVGGVMLFASGSGLVQFLRGRRARKRAGPSDDG